MNEIKRQLNNKMGDTKERTERIMMNVGQKKQRSPLKKKSFKLYYATSALFAVLIVLFFVIQPSITKNTTTFLPASTDESPNNQPAETAQSNLKLFFKQNDDVAYFFGDTIEYSTFTEKTTWLSDKFVQVMVDNGGGVTQQIYKVNEHTIELIYEDMPEFTTANEVTIDYLKTLTPISTLLQWPIENGATFEDKVVTYPVELKTPYKTFSDVIQITQEMDSTIIDYFYVENYGLIGKVTTLKDGFKIYSLLSILNGMPTEDKNARLHLFNKTKNQTESLSFQLFSNYQLATYKSELEKSEITYETIYDAGNRELGILQFNPAKNFSTAFVERSKDSIQIIFKHQGELVDQKYSPNKQFIAFQFSTAFEAGISTLDYLHVIDLDTLSSTSLVEGDEEIIFSSPIDSFKWLDNSTIQYMIPDIEANTLDAILKWQKVIEKPTTPRIATIK